MTKSKSGRRKGKERAKFKRRRMAAVGELQRIYKRKRRIQLRKQARS